MPYYTNRVNTVTTMHSTTNATAGAVDAVVNIENSFVDSTNYVRAIASKQIVLPKNTTLPTSQGTGVGDLSLAYKIPLPGNWRAQAVSAIEAPGTNTVGSFNVMNFTVTP